MAYVILEGNLGGKPEVKYSKDGKARATFNLAWSERQKDFSNGSFFNGPTVWVHVTVFTNAEGVANTLDKGMRVVVSGQLRPESWNSNQGETTVMELVADKIGPSFLFQDLTVSKRPNGSSQGVSGSDPWNSAPSSSAGEDMPPF